MTGKELKNSILQLAISGKLVPQDTTDEPASVLLKRIRKEKEQLVKEGKLKKKDLVSEPINDEEKAFEIPESWEWVRFGNIAYNRDSERIPLSVSERSGLKKIFDYYGASGVIDKVDNYLFDKPLLLIGEDGANLINRSTPIAFIARGKYWVNNHAHVLDFIDENFMTYICTYINAISLVDYVTGTAQPKMNQEKMNSIPIAIPPVAEQRRIVAKIEELMPLIDEYDKAQAELDKLNTTLPEALKKSILQQAICGKLVPQDPTDEPASELLKRIRKEKEQLVKQGKLKKKDLDTTPITVDEKPFDIPNSWQWVRINELALVARGGSPRPIKEYITESNNGVNWIKIGDTEKGGKYIYQCAEKIKPSGVSHSRMVHPGDFLLTNSMSFGRPYITRVEGCIHDGWLVISQYIAVIDSDYLYYLLSSNFAYSQFSDKTAGAVVQNLNKDKVAESIFPLPPLAEQHRIVAKIEQLFALIDK